MEGKHVYLATGRLVQPKTFGKKTVHSSPVKLNSVLLAALLVASGCGGGGGTTGPGDAGSSLSITKPTAVLPTSISTQGSTSDNTTAEYGGGSGTLASYSSFLYDIPDTDLDQQFLPQKHIEDTKAAAQWALGWTGVGENISVIDDFVESSDAAVHLDIERDAITKSTGDTGTYSVTYEVPIVATHGTIVSNIAGGNGRSFKTTQSFNFEAISAARLSCTGSCNDPSISTIFGSDWDAENTSTTYKPAAGVAKDALMEENHVDLSPFQDTQATLNAIADHMDNSATASAINLSVGFNINTVGISRDEIVANLDTAALDNESDAVVVVAAGNSGSACREDNLNGCNALAIAATHLPQTRESAIVAGATTGTNTEEKIASYSTRAGVMADRFLLAPGESGLYREDKFSQTAEAIVGTSFAAPRISGAAALLRHKFPNLDGPQTASILLLTADKDINNDGNDDFTGTSATYGHGKLDLPSAMAPVGTLGVK